MQFMSLLLYVLSIFTLFVYSYFAINYAADIFDRRNKNIPAFIILSIFNTAFVFIGNYMDIPIYVTYFSGVFFLVLQFYFFIRRNFREVLFGASIFILHLICIQMFTISVMSIVLNRPPSDMIYNFDLFNINILIAFISAILALKFFRATHSNDSIRIIAQDKQQSILISSSIIFIIVYSCLDSFAYASKGNYSYLAVTMIAIQIVSMSLFYLLLSHSLKIGKMNHYKVRHDNLKEELQATMKTKNALKDLAFKDSLTGCFTKTYITKYLDDLISNKETGYCVVYIDLDDLKFINDSYGHSEGDYYIKCVSDSVARIFRKEDMFARIGGDEFLLIVENCSERTVVNKLKKAQLILNAFRHKGTQYQMSLSFGVVYIDSKKSNLTQLELLHEVDKKMYLNKKIKKNENNITEV